MVNGHAASKDELKEVGWIKALLDARAQHRRSVFLLHFNIRDLVFDPADEHASPDDLLPLVDFVMGMFDKEVKLYYSLHSGIELRNEAMAMPGKAISSGIDDVLWMEVANHAAQQPFPLSTQDHAPDDPENPQRWRTPGRVIQLLTRALTHEYTLGTDNGRQLWPLPRRTNGVTQRGDQASSLRIGLLIDYLHHLAPEPGPGSIPGHAVPELVEAFQRWSTDPRLIHYDHVVILLAPELAAVHSELRGSDSRIVAIRIPRPDRQERQHFLAWLARFPGYSALVTRTPPTRPNETRIAELANRTAGMNYGDLREFVRTSSQFPERGDDDGDSAWEVPLRRRRAEIIQRESGGLLVLRESRHGLDAVAGYDYVRTYIEPILDHMREGRADVAGILFAGPPGTGKSFFASALARDAGIDMVVMRSLRNMYVGQSERNLEQVLEVARSLAPVVIFIDEIDQAFANRRGGAGGDSGVEQRLLGRLLEFMDDKENLGKVIWIAASNRPDLLDSALLSRFRIRIPFLLPDFRACSQMLHTTLPDQAGFTWQSGTWETNRARIEARVLDEVVGHYSGRELDTLIRTVTWYAEADRALIQREGKEKAFKRKDRPLSEIPIVHRADGRQEIDAAYMTRALERASVGHDENDYLLQSLLALQWVPFDSPELFESVRSVMPSLANDILTTDNIRKDAVAERLNSLLGRQRRAAMLGGMG